MTATALSSPSLVGIHDGGEGSSAPTSGNLKSPTSALILDCRLLPFRRGDSSSPVRILDHRPSG